ncbi:N-acetylmuramoyl-L-alanine amidase [Glutamicibacter sp. FR1]|uniref:peptidoglycan recognition protein family protein n=1 Tax=Glutamicibacter sp. FR1 TaxID=3393744 RepID=UPI0039B0B7FF
MVMFTGLARVANKTGFPVEEVPGWKNTGHGGMDSCSTIIIHHTAGSDNGKDYNSYNTVKNGRPGLPGPLAQFGIGRNTGKQIIFAAGRAWHAGKVGKTAHDNSNAIGIEIENNGVGEKYSDNTYNSAVALTGELVKEFKLNVDKDVLGHKEVAVPRGRKIDPSFSMGKFRADVKAYISGDVKPAGKPSKPAPKPKPKPTKDKSGAWPEKPLKVTDKHTVQSDAAWRELMKAIGYKDKDLGLALQKWLSKLEDPRTGRGYYDTTRFLLDGDFSNESIKALQRKLYDTNGDDGKRLYNGKADGDRGPMTVRAEIGYLNLKANRGIK